MKIHNYLITLMALFAILVASAMEEKKGTKRIAQEEEITLAEPEVGQEIEAIESEPPSKVSKTETSAVPGRLPLEQLPAELQAMIIKALESVPLSTTEPAQLFIAANNIRNLMMSHPAFKGFLNDPNFAGIIIKALSERYAGNDLVEAAVALATDAGGQWLAMQLNNSVVQIDAVKILHLASRNNQIGVIKFLSKYIPAEHLGAIVNQDINDETTLMVAVFFGHLGVVERLLAIPGIDTNKASKSGKTALILASQYGHLAIVERLLAMPGIDVNQIDQQGFTALAWAAYKGHLAIVERLLAVPGINVTMHQQGQQALLVAIRGDYPAIVQRLLAIPGIDVNKKTNKGQSPLWFAQHSTKPNKDAIIKLLKDHGATE